VILQVASLMVRPGREAAFEQAFAKVEPILRDAGGYLSHELRRSVENAQHYALLVEWRRIEDHTLGFVKSLAFERVRSLLQGFFEAAPEVEHFLAVCPRAEQEPVAD
jgi:heme-degrading monooxygenase HmoA